MAAPGGNIFPDNAREGGPGFAGSDALQKFAKQIADLNKAIDEMQKMAGLPKFTGVITTFSAKLDAVTERIKLPFKLIGESLTTLAQLALKASGVMAVAKAAGGASKAAGSAVSLGGDAIGAAIGPLQAVIGEIGKVGNALGNMVGKARPDIMQRFSMAMEDSQAVLGRALAPAMEALGNLMRHVGDAIAANEPSFQALGEAVGKLFEAATPLIDVVVTLAAALADALVPVIEALAPLIQILGEALKPIAQVVGVLAKAFGEVLGGALKALRPVIELIAEAIKFAARIIYEAYRAIDKLNPFTSKKVSFDELMNQQREIKPGASLGAAARRASYSSIEEASRKVALAGAFAGGKSKEEKQLDILGGIHAGINKLIDFAAKQKGSPEEVAKAVEKMKEQLINEQKRQYAGMRT